MQSILVLLALVSAKSLDQLCREAKDAGLDFISIKLPLKSPGITDCKGGKCLPNENTATDCKLYLEYTHPDNSAIAEDFAQEYTTAVANKRHFDGIHFITNTGNDRVVNDYINGYTKKPSGKGHPGKTNILTASYSSYIMNNTFYTNKMMWCYKEIFISVSSDEASNLNKKVPDGAKLVTANEADALKVEAAHPGHEVYVKSEEKLTTYPGLAICADKQ